MRSKFIDADAAAALIEDGATVALMGGGGGLMEATCLFQAIERRFHEVRDPRALTVVHALGIGDRKSLGMNCFAHEELVRKVVGGHWVWSPRMQQLAAAEKIEAYILPGGVSSQLFREIGAGRPGLFTHIGLGTVCDPRHGGGRMNASAKEDLAEVVEIDGREYLATSPTGSMSRWCGLPSRTRTATSVSSTRLRISMHRPLRSRPARAGAR